MSLCNILLTREVLRICYCFNQPFYNKYESSLWRKVWKTITYSGAQMEIWKCSFKYGILVSNAAPTCGCIIILCASWAEGFSGVVLIIEVFPNTPSENLSPDDLSPLQLLNKPGPFMSHFCKWPINNDAIWWNHW